MVGVEIQLLVITNKAYNSSGTKPNKMHFTAAFLLSGAAIILLHPLLFNVIGTSSSLEINLMKP